MLAQVNVLRAGLAEIAEAAAQELNPIWAANLRGIPTREALVEVLPAVLGDYGGAAATLAADWYDETRLTVGATTRFRATPAVAQDPSLERFARWAVSPMFQDTPAVDTAKANIEGGLQRRIFDAARSTTMSAAVEDPASHGWRRIARVDGCEFCLQLAAKGAVYTRETVDFAAHDDCKCQAAPDFIGAQLTPPDYSAALKTASPVELARVNKFLQGHPNVG